MKKIKWDEIHDEGRVRKLFNLGETERFRSKKIELAVSQLDDKS